MRGWSRNRDFDPERASFYEALFTVGNGRLGTRGSLEEGHRGQLSGTYLNGVYDGHDVPVINLVNVPDWVDTTVFVDGIRLDVDTCTVVAHQRVLDLRDGLLTRTTVFEDTAGRRTRLDTVRCASMADRRVCALRVEVTPENHYVGDPRRERDQRGAPQPRTAAALPRGHGLRPGDQVGEVGPRQAPARVVPVRRGRRPLPADAHHRHRRRPGIRRRHDLRPTTTAQLGAPSAASGSPSRPCTGLRRARPSGWTRSSPSAPRATRTGPPRRPCTTGVAPCSPSTARRAGSTRSSRRAARCGHASGTTATARSSGTPGTHAHCGSASTTC